MAEDGGIERLSVLMYHAVTGGAAGEAALSHGERRYAVGLDVFARTLDMLGPTLDPADWGAGGVLLTFDDSLEQHVKVALPELGRRGLKAVFFINTGEIGGPGRLSWDDVKAIADAGHEVASHGVTHRLLAGLGDEEISVELERSRDIIGERTGGRVRFLSLPGGSFDGRVLDAARAAGYRAVFTSMPGVNLADEGLFMVRRFAIRRNYSAHRACALGRGRRASVLRERMREGVFSAVRAVLGRRRYQSIHDSARQGL